MKRAIAFVTALVIAAGAVAPAVSVFADDLPAVPTNSDNLSIWDTSTSTPDNPYNTTDVFNIVNDMWGDLFDDGRFNNTTVSDFQRSYVEWAITKYIEAAPDEEVNGVTVSYFDEIVDYVCAHPSDFDIYWTPDALSLALAGDPYGSLRLGDEFYDNLYDYVIANYYSIPSSGSVTINGHTWVQAPYTIRSSKWGNKTWQYNRYNQSGSNLSDVYATQTSQGLVVCSYVGNSFYCYYGSSASEFFLQTPTSRVTSTGNWYYGSTSSWSFVGLASQYSTVSDAVNDFYGNVITSDSVPVSNGKVYIRDQPIGGNNLTVSYPAYPVSNSKAVSNYYYTTYGDTWEDNSTVIDDTVYNNNLTTLYPVTYDNNIPLWLIQSNSTIETFDYSLELPSAPLETLPSDFEGGGSFFQSSFVVLGGFGAFVLVGLSFSLVGLFFKE